MKARTLYIMGSIGCIATASLITLLWPKTLLVYAADAILLLLAWLFAFLAGRKQTTL